MDIQENIRHLNTVTSTVNSSVEEEELLKTKEVGRQR